MTDIKSSKRASRHFKEACGRMYIVGGLIIIFLYISKYNGPKLDIVNLYLFVEYSVGLLNFVMLLWPAIYARNHFGAIYRFFLLRMRKYNMIVVDTIFFPGILMLLVSWVWISLLSYPSIIQQFLNDGIVRPILTLLAGFIFLFMFTVLLTCRFLAHSRGIKLKNKNYTITDVPSIVMMKYGEYHAWNSI